MIDFKKTEEARSNLYQRRHRKVFEHLQESLIVLQQNPRFLLAFLLIHLQQAQLLFHFENPKQSSLDEQTVEANPQWEVFSETYENEMNHLS